ncbi:MAG: hypothetical protein SGARI_007970, partial [Bacillariaceae sp.]
MVSDNISLGSSASEQTTSSCSTAAAVATPSRKYRNQQKSVTSPEASLSPSGAATVTSLLSNGGSILEQKRLRKRMALMEMERNRNLNPTTTSGLRSFDQVHQDKTSALVETKLPVASSAFSSTTTNGNAVASFSSHTSSHFESEDAQSSTTPGVTCSNTNANATNGVSELRRRRLYEMHQNRPYSQSKPKKKFKFWQQEPQPQQTNLLKQQQPHQQGPFGGATAFPQSNNAVYGN